MSKGKLRIPRRQLGIWRARRWMATMDEQPGSDKGSGPTVGIEFSAMVRDKSRIRQTSQQMNQQF